MTMVELESLVMEQQAAIESMKTVADNVFMLSRAFTVLTMVCNAAH